MGRYLWQVSYSKDAWGAQISNPQNRLEMVGAMLEPLGVKLIEGYATLGEYDIIAIIEAPDDKTIAAASIAISSTGSVSALKTSPLMPIDDLVEALNIAKKITYKPPSS
jgi:uncharacterized protein with GYD domain